ncbi:Arc family DNA-binding protein [Undibacterium sp.]|uniref:Arc family DNA-binding protein n=1 Tax=Undibacterium sp. TaxID=1914977 RepID=UPI003751C6BA
MQKNELLTVSRESEKFQVRLPDGMRQKISVQAKLNGRSMNAEIIARLTSSFCGDAVIEKELLSRQSGLIAFLCQCIDQLSTITPSSDDEKAKIDLILALYKSMFSGGKIESDTPSDME